jgi:hypothetical protein
MVMLRTIFSGLMLALVLAGCGSSDSSAGGDAGDGGLSDTFHDCGATVCQVSLAAFTDNAGAIPYCPAARADVDLSCADNPGLQTGTCGDLWTARVVYGFPGDFYECSYDSGGALVGAKWAPDNHPTQIAGTQPPDTCTLGAQCADAGTD